MLPRLGHFAAWIWLLSALAVDAAEPRIALIIGNSEYAKRELRLANPANDALAMQRALQSAGFETLVKLNAKRVEFYRATDEFEARIGRDPHAVGLFYYAGHGVQAEGTNYLIPVDADIQAEADLEANAFDAGRVLKAMRSAQNDMNIVILDACRNNPLPKTRGMGRGLARMDAPSGTFIAYAAAPGQTAQDGASGSNGVFTGELIKAIAEPGLPLEQMFKKVIAGVKADTHGGQEPWSESSIQGDFYFHAAAVASAAPRAGLDPKQIELAFWESIKDSKDPADFSAYLKHYPQGDFAGIASNRLRALKPSEPPRNASPDIAVRTAPAQTEHPLTDQRREPLSRRCQAMMDRVQAGDTLSAEDLAYLKANCR